MKIKKMIFSVVPAIILSGSIASFVSAENVNTTTQMTANIQNGISSKYDATSLDGMKKPAIDITLGNKLPLSGYFTRNVTVGNETRTVKIYIAPGTSVRDYFTVIATPEGMTTAEFLKSTGWLDIANKNSEGLFILEPGLDGWESAEKELAYINEAMKILKDTTYYNTFGLFYLAGYGDGGTALQAWAMENPLSVISSTFIQTEDLNTDFIASTGAKTFHDNKNISFNEVPVPIWFVNEDLYSVENLIKYWKKANDTVEDGHLSSNGLMGSMVFMQDKHSDSIVTSYSDVSSQVAVLEKAGNGVYKKGFTSKVYDFLSYYTRYDTTTINGNVLGVRPNYKKMGVETKQMVLNGYTREYLVYTPKSAPKRNIPVVFALSGNTQTAQVFFDASHWWEVADKYGFMLVVPSEQYSSSTEVTWNVNYDPTKQDDFVFLEEVIKQIEKDYKINPNKRYLTGQSLGSMFSNYATAVFPQYFAAVGSTSGPLLRSVEGKTDKIPFYLFFGENDLWSWDHKKDGQTKNTIEYWLNRNNLGGLNDAVVTKKDRYTTYTWYDENKTPFYKYTQTEDRAHNFIVSEVWELWEEWFSKWEINKNGVRRYID